MSFRRIVVAASCLAVLVACSSAQPGSAEADLASACPFELKDDVGRDWGCPYGATDPWLRLDGVRSGLAPTVADFCDAYKRRFRVPPARCSATFEREAELTVERLQPGAARLVLERFTKHGPTPDDIAEESAIDDIQFERSLVPDRLCATEVDPREVGRCTDVTKRWWGVWGDHPEPLTCASSPFHYCLQSLSVLREPARADYVRCVRDHHAPQNLEFSRCLQFLDGNPPR